MLKTIETSNNVYGQITDIRWEEGAAQIVHHVTHVAVADTFAESLGCEETEIWEFDDVATARRVYNETVSAYLKMVAKEAS